MDQLATGGEITDAATGKFEVAFNEIIFGDARAPLTSTAAQKNLERLGYCLGQVNAKGWLIYLAGGDRKSVV